MLSPLPRPDLVGDFSIFVYRIFCFWDMLCCRMIAHRLPDDFNKPTSISTTRKPLSLAAMLHDMIEESWQWLWCTLVGHVCGCLKEDINLNYASHHRSTNNCVALLSCLPTFYWLSLKLSLSMPTVMYMTVTPLSSWYTAASYASPWYSHDNLVVDAGGFCHSHYPALRSSVLSDLLSMEEPKHYETGLQEWDHPPGWASTTCTLWRSSLRADDILLCMLLLA